MREITTHKGNVVNNAIRVTAEDERGSDGANHVYRVCVPVLDPAEKHVAENSKRMQTYCDIHFQNGPVGEVGVNGITHESLLAVLIDRLRCFQNGLFSCRENALALTKLEEALHWLNERTKNRVVRGVEGTHTP